jgi:4'-phosphopantetheinyl transferase
MNRLKSNDVHLWRVAIAHADTPSATRVLSEDERRRATRYRFDRHRREFMIARAVLRLLLADYTGLSAERLCFTHNQRGKPSLDGSIQFNVSHAADVALIAISCMPVGVDIERVDPDFAWQGIARHFFSSAECEWIASHPSYARCESFLRCWTRREAFVKARGSGLPTEGACGLASTIRYHGRTWSIQSVAPFLGYIGAIAAEGEVFKVRAYDWNELPHGNAVAIAGEHS